MGASPRDVVRFSNSGGQSVLCGGDNQTPLVEIGLTELLTALAHPAHSLAASLPVPIPKGAPVEVGFTTFLWGDLTTTVAIANHRNRKLVNPISLDRNLSHF